MESGPPLLGVATAAEPTAQPTPTPWPDQARWLNSSVEKPVALPPPTPPTWPRSAQMATGLLLFLSLGLLAWHLIDSRRGAARPTLLEPNDASTFRLDLNRASHVELLQLQGVGENLARRIEAYRHEHGGFRSVDELRRVSGIGPVLLEKLRPLVFVEEYEEEEGEGLDKPQPAAPPRKEAMPVKPAKSGKEAKLGDPIDVNRASAEELQKLPGIGPKIAERILEARRKEPFKTVGDLRKVPGIGPKTLERLRPHVTVGD
jgi:competence protein ComEA